MSISGALLIDYFIAQKQINTSDGMGGYTRTYSNQYQFRGRLSSISATELVAYNRPTTIATHKLFCAYNINIDETWRIKYNMADDAERYFEIVAVIKPSNLTTGHLELILKEIK